MKETVLITGATRGIGKATAYLFAEHGAHVIINYNKSETAAKEIVQDLHENGYAVTAIQADVSKENEVGLMFERLRELRLNIDILINNAGIAQQKLFTDISSNEWHQMFATHVDGTFYCTQAVLPYMIEQKFGRIINISSVWGITGASCEVHYSASKAAIIGFTKALAKELGPSNITVNCVAPGVIETDMNRDLDNACISALIEETPLCRIGNTLDVAEMIYFLSSEKASFVTGQIFSPNGGFLI